MTTASNFTELSHGPYGQRWSYTYDADEATPPTVEEAGKALGVKLADRIVDASDERTDGLCEAVYFAAEEFSGNTLATYQVQ